MPKAVRLAEVKRDGTVADIDPVANYRHDVERWGARTANHNARYVLRVLSGLEAPPDTTVEDARRELDASDPATTESLVVALPEGED